LYDLADGRQTLEWNQTAEVLAAIYNSNPYRARTYQADQFNPMARGQSREPEKPPQISDEAAMRIFEHVWGLKPGQQQVEAT